jgi:hypothetical protein
VGHRAIEIAHRADRHDSGVTLGLNYEFASSNWIGIECDGVELERLIEA